MGRLVAGQNVTSWKYESGLYASPSGTSAQWVGLVQSFDPGNDTENIQRLRYHGTNTRNVDVSTIGARDYGGTFEFFPQDWKFMMFALGSIGDGATAGGVYTHYIGELNSDDLAPMTSGTENPFTSFGIESTQQFNDTGENLGRTYKGGVVNSMTLSKTDASAPLSCSVDFVAKERVFTSGAVTFGAPTENTIRPFVPSDSLVHLPSGTKLDVNTWEFVVNNNFDTDGAHVCNGSREITAPTATERDYTLTITMPAESSQAGRLFEMYNSGGAISNNAGIAITNQYGSTSGTSWIALSGCDVDSFNAPNPVEGVNEWELTLIPKSAHMTAQDTTAKYKMW